MKAAHNQDPTTLSMQTVMPLVCEKMDSNQQLLTAHIADVKNSINANGSSLTLIENNLKNVVTSNE